MTKKVKDIVKLPSKRCYIVWDNKKRFHCNICEWNRRCLFVIRNKIIEEISELEVKNK